MLKPGKTYDIKIEYMDLSFTAVCKLNWRRAAEEQFAKRSVWLPPGTWIDAWSGETQTGPKSIEMKVPLAHIPMFVKAGTIVPLAPVMQYTGEKAVGSDHAGCLPGRIGRDDAVRGRWNLQCVPERRVSKDKDRGRE